MVWEPPNYDRTLILATQELPVGQERVLHPPEWFVTLHHQVQQSYAAFHSLLSTTTENHDRLQALRADYDNLFRDYAFTANALQHRQHQVEGLAENLHQLLRRDCQDFGRTVNEQLVRYSNDARAREAALDTLISAVDQQGQRLAQQEAQTWEQLEFNNKVTHWAGRTEERLADLLHRSDTSAPLTPREQAIVDDLRQYTIAAVAEARRDNTVTADVVMETLADRSRKTGSLKPPSARKKTTGPALKKSTSSRADLELTDDALRHAATRATMAAAQRQTDAMRYSDVMMSGGAGGGGALPPRRGGGPDDPSPSSSDNGDDSDDDFVKPSLRPRRKETKPEGPPLNQEAEAFAALMGQLTRPAPTITMNKPEKFSGKDKRKFEAWWLSVKSYASVHKRSFADDEAKICWLGSLYTDVALEWHQKRTKQLEKLDVLDHWSAYSTALKERFRDPARRHRDLKAMKDLKYRDDISEYITKLQELNYSVSVSGIALQDLVTRTVPEEVVKMVYNREGDLPEEDNDFLDAIVRAGLVYETMQANPALHRRESGKDGSGSRSEHKKPDKTPSSNSRSNSDRPAKNEKKRKRDDGGDHKKSDTPREKCWKDSKTALAGVDNSDVEKHKKAGAKCWRCGRNNHRSVECYAKKNMAGKDLPTAPERVSSVKQLKERTDPSLKNEETEPPPPAKKARIASMWDRHPELFPRVVELSDDTSDGEEDF